VSAPEGVTGYEAPAIASRHAIDLPLVGGVASGNADSNADV
jgi:hypothetical protein